MPRYKVKYQGEVHDIDWTGPGKPSKDELRLAISNKILEKDAPPPLSLSNKYQLPKPPSPSKFDTLFPEMGASGFVSSHKPTSFDEKYEKAVTTPLLPDIDTEPETWTGGFAKGLYNEWGKPLSSIRGLGTAALIASGKWNPDYNKLRKVPELEPPPTASNLELPGTPRNFANEPIPRGSTTYGITPRPTDNPMLAHVPERYQPTAPVQEHFDRMLPSSIRERIKAAEELGDEGVESVIRNSQNEIREARGLNKIDDIANEIQSKARQAADERGIPELKNAIDEVGDDIHNVSSDPAASMSSKTLAEAARKTKERRGLKDVWNSVVKSGDTELKDMGDAGKAIWRKIADRDHIIRREAQAAKKGMSAEEWDKVGGDAAWSEQIGKQIDQEMKSELDELIKQTPNPKRTQEIIDNHMGKNMPDNPGWKIFNDKVKAIQAITKLQTFGIKNLIGGNVNTWLHSPTKQYITALKDFVTNRKAVGDFADEAGASWSINKSIAEGLSNDLTQKWYGGNLTEKINRDVAAWTGRGYVRQLFNELKQDPTSKFKRGKLEEFLLEDADDILKQDSLTHRQELLAAGRHAEITQGLGGDFGRRRLPVMASKEGNFAQMPWVFRKYAFQQTKELKDALASRSAGDKAKLILKLGALSQLSGEAIGAVRAATVGGVKGAIRGDVNKGVSDEFKDRTEYIGRYTKNIPVFGPEMSENWMVNRLVGNVMEGWGLGLTADLMEGLAGGSFSTLRTIAGAPVSQAADIIGAVGSLDPKALGREALRALPIPILGGAGIQRALLPTNWQSQREDPEYQARKAKTKANKQKKAEAEARGFISSGRKSRASRPSR